MGQGCRIRKSAYEPLDSRTLQVITPGPIILRSLLTTGFLGFGSSLANWMALSITVLSARGWLFGVRFIEVPSFILVLFLLSIVDTLPLYSAPGSNFSSVPLQR
jgi:hypothetical protein